MDGRYATTLPRGHALAGDTEVLWKSIAFLVYHHLHDLYDLHVKAVACSLMLTFILGDPTMLFLSNITDPEKVLTGKGNQGQLHEALWLATQLLMLLFTAECHGLLLLLLLLLRRSARLLQLLRHAQLAPATPDAGPAKLRAVRPQTA
jgi:hypothetical protein